MANYNFHESNFRLMKSSQMEKKKEEGTPVLPDAPLMAMYKSMWVSEWASQLESYNMSVAS